MSIILLTCYIGVFTVVSYLTEIFLRDVAEAREVMYLRTTFCLVCFLFYLKADTKILKKSEFLATILKQERALLSVRSVFPSFRLTILPSYRLTGFIGLILFSVFLSYRFVRKLFSETF